MPTTHVTVPSREDLALVLFKALELFLGRWGRCEIVLMGLMSLTGLFYHVEQVVLLSVESQAGKSFGSSSIPSLFLLGQMIHFCHVLNFPTPWAIHSQLPLSLHPSRGNQPFKELI